MKNQLFKNLILSACFFSFLGCSSTTLIRSTDPEARIYVDNEYRGKGSYSHSDTKIVGSDTQVRLEKEGCAPVNYTFSRSEAFDAGACIGGIFFLVPFLWIQKYKPERNYEFNCTPKTVPTK